MRAPPLYFAAIVEKGGAILPKRSFIPPAPNGTIELQRGAAPMTVRERMLAIRLMEKVERCPAYLEMLHLTIGMKKSNNNINKENEKC